MLDRPHLQLVKDSTVPTMADSLKAIYDLSWPTPELHQYLAKHDLKDMWREIEANCSLLSVTLCTAFEGPSGLIFRFDPQGVPTVVIAAHRAGRESPMDLVGWPLHGNDPDNFATFRNEAEVLGATAMCSPRRQMASKPLRLHRHPHDWIVSRFDGSVILNKRHGGHWLSKVKGPFVCADLEHGREVAAMLRRFNRAHEVLIPSANNDGRIAA